MNHAKCIDCGCSTVRSELMKNKKKHGMAICDQCVCDRLDTIDDAIATAIDV